MRKVAESTAADGTKTAACVTVWTAADSKAADRTVDEIGTATG